MAYGFEDLVNFVELLLFFVLFLTVEVLHFSEVDFVLHEELLHFLVDALFKSSVYHLKIINYCYSHLILWNQQNKSHHHLT